MEPITSVVQRYHRQVGADANHRYRSWEHCYRFFQSRPSNLDHGSLHLAFYLASWGMYRGSSFLLQKDYRIHLPVVEELLNSRHALINSPSLGDLTGPRAGELIDRIFELIQWIKAWYVRATPPAVRDINVTDTLATKILLGTLACVPAYDRFFVAGLKANGLRQSCTKKNLAALLSFCLRNEGQFRAAQRDIEKDGCDYPVMKVVDMYFWQLGEQSSPMV